MDITPFQVVGYFGIAVSLLGAWWVGCDDRDKRSKGFQALICALLVLAASAVDAQAWGAVAAYALLFPLAIRGYLANHGGDHDR